MQEATRLKWPCLVQVQFHETLNPKPLTLNPKPPPLKVKCCGGADEVKGTEKYQGDHCNFANGVGRGAAPHLLAVLAAALMALFAARA